MKKTIESESKNCMQGSLQCPECNETFDPSALFECLVCGDDFCPVCIDVHVAHCEEELSQDWLDDEDMQDD